MRTFLLFLMLLQGMTLLGQGVNVSVQAQLSDSTGRPLQWYPVLVTFYWDQTNSDLTWAITDDQGGFGLDYELPAGIGQASVVLEVADCNDGSLRFEQEVDLAAPELDFDLSFCPQGQQDCHVEIIAGVDCVGQVFLSALGLGSPDVTLEWSDGQTGHFILPDSALSEYCVTLTDGAGCTAEACIELDSISFCEMELFGIYDGFGYYLYAISPGGMLYDYEWNNGSTDMFIYVQEEGEYCVTMRGGDCELTKCIHTDSLSGNHFCSVYTYPVFDESGALILETVAFGTGEISYQWSDGSTTPSIQPAAAGGEYCVSITDEGGCESEACIDLEGVELCGVYVSGFYDGSAYQLYAIPAVQGEYAYSWSDGSEEPYITTFEEGEHCVTISLPGCTATACIHTDSLRWDKTCYAELFLNYDEEWQLTIEALAFGTGEISYLWSDGSTEKSLRPDSIGGTYCLTITDAIGCQSEACIVLDSLELCAAYIFGYEENGVYHMVAFSTTVGNADFTWSDGTEGPYFSTDVAGEYCVTVTSPGCEATACIHTDDLDGFEPCVEAYLVYNYETTTGRTELSVVILDGTEADIEWTTGATTPTIELVDFGWYGVTVTSREDPSCELELGYFHSQPWGNCPADIEINYLQSDSLLLSFQAPEGAVVSDIMWSTGDTTQSIRVSIYDERMYCVTALLDGSCYAVACQPLGNNAAGIFSAQIVPRRIEWTDEVILTAVIAPVKAVSYLWNTGETTSQISTFEAGTYTVTVTAADGSESTASITIDRRGVILDNNDWVITGWHQVEIVPNPATSHATLLFKNADTGIMRLSVYSADGRLVMRQDVPDLYVDTSVVLDTENLQPGVYFVRAETARAVYQGKFVRQ